MIKIAENIYFPHELVIPEIPARRAAWVGEKEESASHHLFAFAQLRAEMAENDARRPPENIRKWEILKFQDT